MNAYQLFAHVKSIVPRYAIGTDLGQNAYERWFQRDSNVLRHRLLIERGPWGLTFIIAYLWNPEKLFRNI